MVRELFTSSEELDDFLIKSCLENNIEAISWLAVNYPIKKLSIKERIINYLNRVNSFKLNFWVKDGYIFKKLIKANNEKTLVYILEKLKQKDILLKTKFYFILLETSINNGNLKVFDYLLRLNNYILDNKTIDKLVYFSCFYNKREILNYLIKKFQVTPSSPSLRIAVYFGHFDVVEYLIKNNENLLLSNQDIFDLVFEKNHVSLLDYFFQNDNITKMLKNSKYVNLAFMFAAKSKNINLLRYLLLDLNIKMDQELKEFLIRSPSKEVDSIILHNSLNKNLKIVELIKKENYLTKTKI